MQQHSFKILSAFLSGCVLQDANNKPHCEVIWQNAQIIWNEKSSFLLRLAKWDAAIPADMIEAQEYLFDLFMMHYLMQNPDILDESKPEPKEWLDVEEATAERGTEFLNLITYADSATQEEFECDMDDFLDNYLMLGDDDVVDDMELYDIVLENRNLVSAVDFGDIQARAQTIDGDHPLAELFLPIMTFFAANATGQDNINLFLNTCRPNTSQAGVFASLMFAGDCHDNSVNIQQFI